MPQQETGVTLRMTRATGHLAKLKGLLSHHPAASAHYWRPHTVPAQPEYSSLFWTGGFRYRQALWRTLSEVMASTNLFCLDASL